MQNLHGHRPSIVCRGFPAVTEEGHCEEEDEEGDEGLPEAIFYSDFTGEVPSVFRAYAR